MKYSEIISPSIRLIEANQGKQFGRNLNHLEHLVIFYGIDGVTKVINILKDLASDDNDLTVKWDGKLAIYYGRDPVSGLFSVGTKANWVKNEPKTSAKEISSYIANAGKGEDFRKPMSEDLQRIFPYLEASVPAGFKGFVTGDIIYSPILSPKQTNGDSIVFTPSQVTYTVDSSSNIGKRINQTEVGIALHQKFDSWNGTGTLMDDATVSQLNSSDVFTIGQVYSPIKPKIDTSVISDLSAAASNGKMVDDLIEPRKGLSDMSNILYTFHNQLTRERRLDKLSTNEFLSWLPNSKVSENKQLKINAMVDENPNAFSQLFELINSITYTKNNIIEQLDAGETDVKSSIDGQAGGEGYVSSKHKIKLVPRHKWAVS